MTFNLPANEELRIKTLYQLELLDTPIDHNFEKIIRLAQKIFSTPIAGISFIDKNREWFKSILGLDCKEIPRTQSFGSEAILTTGGLVVADATKDSKFNQLELVVNPPNIQFYAGYPIKLASGVNIGTLFLMDSQARGFSEHDQVCLKELTTFVEDEISNHVNNFVINYENQLLSDELSKLQRVAAVDPLTQLWNRVGIKKFFENLRSKTIRNNTSFAIGLIDLDRFKQINDTYGHAAGDLTLKQIATVLINTVRRMDTVGRWGGDEFIVFLDSDDIFRIKDIFERINHNIKQLEIKYENNIIHPSATIGVTLCQAEKMSLTQGLEDFLEKADKSLYKGKHAGDSGKVFYQNN